MEVHLTKAAKADLKTIARYTNKEHGKEQRNKYLNKIDDAFSLISENPNTGTDFSYIMEGYRKYPFEKYIIFYRKVNSDEIEIVRILHNKMDVKNRL